MPTLIFGFWNSAAKFLSTLAAALTSLSPITTADWPWR